MKNYKFKIGEQVIVVDSKILAATGKLMVGNIYTIKAYAYSTYILDVPKNEWASGRHFKERNLTSTYITKLNMLDERD